MISNRFRLGLVLLAVSGAAACSEPMGSPDYRITHPVTVHQENVTLSLRPPISETGISAENKMRLARFVDHFQAKGVGAIRIRSLGDGGYESSAWADGARRLLLMAGVGPDRIVMTDDTGSGDGGSPAILLSFTGNAAAVPECGRASFNYAFNPNNLPNADWGCAAQRNLGLMVRNPGDLVRAQPVSERDPARTINTIVDYRTGAVTPSSKSPEQQNGFQGSEGTGRVGGGGGINSNTVTRSTDAQAPAPIPTPAPTPAPTAPGGQ
jgi:pilus assembly protein CpaD